jgi:hypothetical protein
VGGVTPYFIFLVKKILPQISKFMLARVGKRLRGEKDDRQRAEG